jgi:DNA-binding transcriptional MerR regulator
LLISRPYQPLLGLAYLIANLIAKNRQNNSEIYTFSDHDARIIAWIAALKAQNMPADEVTLILQNAKSNSWRNLPPLPGGMANDEPIAVVPREAVEERFQAIQEQHRLQLEAVIAERETLKRQLEKAHEEIDTLRQDSAQKIEKLQGRIMELAEKEAELRGELKQYAVAGRQVSVTTLLGLALLVGALFTVVLLVLLSLLGK